MKRRNFMQLGLVSAGVSSVMLQSAQAGTEGRPEAGSVYFTREEPGRWSQKVAGHLPTIEVSLKNGQQTVRVITSHEMNGYEHYIVKHVLLDKNFKFIGEHMFNPLEDKIPESVFVLENYQGKLYALSMCNKHDVWLNEYQA